MGRFPCCDKVGLKKGPWTPEEDQKLLTYIQEHGHGSWRALPPKAGLQRCGKSCRLRWTNYLRPDIKRGKFSLQEEQTIIQLHALLGNRWSAIASHLPKRTDNEIKNYWNTHLKKRLIKMGIDPMTHKPKNHALGSGQPKDIANLSHMAQWESARLEAEARIVRENKLVANSIHSILLNKAKATARPPQPRPPCLDILKVWQGAWTKPRKDTTAKIVNGFFTSKGSLESPMSILNFANNTVPIPNIDLIQENALVRDINYVRNPIEKNQLKGIMENSTQFSDIIDNPTSFITYSADPLEVPSFLEGYTDFAANVSSASTTIGLADDVFEENKNSYWNNILSHVVNSPINSIVF